MNVSIVIPAYNRCELLKRAVNSVLYQTYKEYTLIVVNDKSEADLSDCQKLVESNGHIWVDLPENKGPAAARNYGAGLLAFDWLMFLDSDDVWFPEKIEQHIRWHKSHPEFRISQVREKWVRNGVDFTKPKHLKQPAGDIFSDSLNRCAIGPSCVAIRKDLWSETDGFDEWFRVCEDYELWLRITCREPVGLVDGEVLVEKHGGHSDQLSTAVPALDRFRFVALAQFLRNTDLTKSQRTKVGNQIANKMQVLAKGAGKRDRNEWKEFFANLIVPLSIDDLEKAKRYCLEPVT